MCLSLHQIEAYLEFSDKLDRLERALALVDTAYGTSADTKAITKRVKEIVGNG